MRRGRVQRLYQVGAPRDLERGETSNGAQDTVSEEITPPGGGNRQNETTDGRDDQIKRLMDLVAVQSQQISALIAREGGGRQVVNVGPTSMEKFQKLQPPNFGGYSTDPTVAEEWIRKLEDMFEFAKVEEADKVTCAAYMLSSEARFWWDSIKIGQDMAAMTWEKFKDLFNAKYFDLAIQTDKLVEFTQLRQTGTVAEYVRKFESLSRYASHMVIKEEYKVHHFVQGLKDEIFRGVMTAGIREASYTQVVLKAYDVEKGEAKCNRLGSGQRKFFKEVFPQQGKSWPQKGFKRPSDFKTGPQDSGKRVQIAAPQHPVCPKCSKSHRGECLAGSGHCFICKKAGHQARECPMQRQGQRGVQPRLFAMVDEEGAEQTDNQNEAPRLFAMAEEESEEPPAMISGTYLISFGG